MLDVDTPTSLHPLSHFSLSDRTSQTWRLRRCKLPEASGRILQELAIARTTLKNRVIVRGGKERAAATAVATAEALARGGRGEDRSYWDAKTAEKAFFALSYEVFSLCGTVIVRFNCWGFVQIVFGSFGTASGVCVFFLRSYLATPQPPTLGLFCFVVFDYYALGGVLVLMDGACTRSTKKKVRSSAWTRHFPCQVGYTSCAYAGTFVLTITLCGARCAIRPLTTKRVVTMITHVTSWTVGGGTFARQR